VVDSTAPVRKIAAIKLYRELTGVGFLEAKNALEAFQCAGH
jgi:ribosomal protein L7/L12